MRRRSGRVCAADQRPVFSAHQRKAALKRRLMRQGAQQFTRRTQRVRFALDNTVQRRTCPHRNIAQALPPPPQISGLSFGPQPRTDPGQRHTLTVHRAQQAALELGISIVKPLAFGR